MSSSRGVTELGVDLTAAAERKKKRARSVRKRKIDEVLNPSTVLPPITEVDEVSASQGSQGEPAPAPTRGVQVGSNEDAVRAPELHSSDDPDQMTIRLEVRRSDAAANDPLLARRLMEAVILPSDRLEVRKMSFPVIHDQFSYCIAQANTIFSTTKEMFEEQMKIQRLESEEREAATEARFQAFQRESTQEFQLLQDELVRVNGLLSKSEEEARLGKEALKVSHARCKHAERRQEELEKDLKRAKELAVSEFKKSEEFGDLVADVVFPAFYDGFEDCQEKAREKHPQVDLSSLIPKYGTREEILGDAGEEGDEAGEEETQDKPQRNPELQKGKAAVVEEEETGGPSSQDQPSAFLENPDFADLMRFVAYMVIKDKFWARMFSGFQEKGPGFEKPPLHKVYTDPRMEELQGKFGSGFVMNLAQNTGLFIFAFGVGYNKCLNKVKEGFPEVDSEFLLLTDLDISDLLADTMRGEPMSYIKVVSDCVDEYGRLAQIHLDDLEKQLKAEDRKKKSRKKRK